MFRRTWIWFDWIGLDWIEYSLTPHLTQYRSFQRRSSQPITSCWLLQTLLLWDVSFSHDAHAQRHGQRTDRQTNGRSYKKSEQMCLSYCSCCKKYLCSNRTAQIVRFCFVGSVVLLVLSFAVLLTLGVWKRFVLIPWANTIARRPSSVCPSVNFLRKSLLLEINGSIATKLAHDGVQVSMRPGCAQGQGHGHMTYMIAQKSLLPR